MGERLSQGQISPSRPPDAYIALYSWPLAQYLEKRADILGVAKFFEKWKKRRQRKKILKIIRRQAKAGKTVKFNYTNLKGINKLREVDPYEIKSGYLWATEHRNPRFIKRFFMNKLKNVSPGINVYKPKWEVKIAQEKLAVIGGKILRNPAILRGAEVLIGAGIGGGYGYGATAGQPAEIRRQKAIENAASGAVLAALLSAGMLHRKRLAAVAKSQIRKWDRTPASKAIMEFRGKAPIMPLFARRYGTTKVLRKELDRLSTGAGRKAFLSKGKDFVIKRILKDNAGDIGAVLKTWPKKDRTAFVSGLYRLKRPYIGTASASKAYSMGQNIRQQLIAANEKLINTQAKQYLDTRLDWINRVIAEDNAKFIERVMGKAKKKLFGVL